MSDFMFEAAHMSGKIYSEKDCFWDKVPHNLDGLKLVTSDGQIVVDLVGAPGRRFFFCNEGIAMLGSPGILSAKILGYAEDKYVYEWRLDLLVDKVPQLQKRVYLLTEFEQVGALRRAT